MSTENSNSSSRLTPIDSSGNKYLRTDDINSPIIDTFENKKKSQLDMLTEKLKNVLIEKEEEIRTNKKLSEENKKMKDYEIPILLQRLKEANDENKETLYELAILKKRLSDIDYNSSTDQKDENITLESNGIELTSIVDDDKLISSSKREDDVTSYDPFKLLSELIFMFNEIKNILKRLINGAKEYQHNININEQESDDLLFYKSIILDSKKFFLTSHKIRKSKLIYDLNEILKMFNYPHMPTVNEINKTTHNIIRKYYIKLAKEVKNNNDTADKPLWIKNNKLKYIETIKREMNRSFLYHLQINSYYRDCLINELSFFKIKN